MKPLGQKPTRFPKKTDCHPKRMGLVNWWENIPTQNKARHKRDEKQEIIVEGNHRSGTVWP